MGATDLRTFLRQILHMASAGLTRIRSTRLCSLNHFVGQSWLVNLRPHAEGAQQRREREREGLGFLGFGTHEQVVIITLLCLLASPLYRHAKAQMLHRTR